MPLDLHRNYFNLGKSASFWMIYIKLKKPPLCHNAITLELISQHNMISQTLITYPSAVSSAPIHVSQKPHLYSQNNTNLN